MDIKISDGWKNMNDNHRTISVNTDSNNYNIHIGNGILSDTHKLIAPFSHGQKWVIITHRNIWNLYEKDLSSVLIINQIAPAVIFVDEGENSKSLKIAESIYSQLIQLGCDRSTHLLAFGGGVIGDLTGYIAATFMRGMPYIQIPTSLLAMVDSSVGGKTAVNISEGKNLVGVFYQPQMVIIDPHLLKSLPHREIYSAIAEIIKTAAIYDSSFFNNLISIITSFNDSGDVTVFTEAIFNSCKIKSAVVSQDEKEGGIRKILNFGHTIGHAVETSLGHGNIRHGEAVAFGMLCAGFISHKYGTACGLSQNLSENNWRALQELIRLLPLPDIKIIDSDHIIKIIRRDKKNMGDIRNFILLEELGKPVISSLVSDEIIKISLENV